MQTKASPDNKRTRSEVGSGNSGQLEGDVNKVGGSSSTVHSDDLGNESDNASELVYCLAEPSDTTSEEWQVVRPKHTRKQRSFDALNAEITQPITPGVAQNGYGPPSEANFLAACGVLPQRRQETATLPVKATNKWGRRQWDPGRHWDPDIPQPINGYLVHGAPKPGCLVYEVLAQPEEDKASMGSPVEETIQLCLWARPYHKFGYPTGEHVWSRAVAIVPTLPQRLRQPGDTMLAVGQGEAIRAPMKNEKALEPTKTVQGKQVYTKITTCGRPSGTVGKGVGQGVWNTGVMYTGQTGTVSVGYPRLAAQRVPKPPGLLGDTSSSSDLYGTFSHTGTHVR